jgi:hypothetical protein
MTSMDRIDRNRGMDARLASGMTGHRCFSRCTALALALLLAACQRAPENDSLSGNIVDRGEAGIDNDLIDEALPPDEGGENAATPPAGRAEAPTDDMTVPARLRGQWTGLRARCDDPADPLRLTITGHALRYYESVGQVTSVARADQGAVIVSAAFSGEGDNWTRAQLMSVSPDGKRLTIITNGEAVVRKRCGGGPP